MKQAITVKQQRPKMTEKPLPKGTIFTISGFEVDNAGRQIRDGICIKTGKPTPYPKKLVRYEVV